MEEIDNFIKAINNYLSGEASVDAIEDATTPFLIDDGNKLKDEELADIVYQLDMHEIEELSRSDIIKLRTNWSSLDEELRSPHQALPQGRTISNNAYKHLRPS